MACLHVVRQGARRGPLRRVFKHMSHAGTSPKGGILLVAAMTTARRLYLPTRATTCLPRRIPMLYRRARNTRAGPARFAMSRFAGCPSLQGAGRHGGIVGLNCRRRARRAHAPAEDFVFPPAACMRGCRPTRSACRRASRKR